MWATHELGVPKPFDANHPASNNHYSLDSHPLIREVFSKRLQETSATTWMAAHSRLFEHLQASVPYWPEGLVDLQPLYQAVAHGCQARRFEESLMDVFIRRISRGTSGQHPNPYASYSTTMLGAFGTDLSAVAFFFDRLGASLSFSVHRTSNLGCSPARQRIFSLRGAWPKPSSQCAPDSVLT